jgi:hypothetical protein
VRLRDRERRRRADVVTALTYPQARALAVLYNRTHNGGVVYPRELAEALWPDSRGWDRRSRRMATPAGGALGATMPMKAATLLWRLHRRGYAQLAGTRFHGERLNTNRWEITASGIAEHLRNGVVE